MTRRTLLRRGLFGGALLLLGGTGLALLPTKETATTPTLAVLTPHAFQVLVAVARRVVVAPDADAARIAKGIDEALESLAPEAQLDMNRLLALFENALSGLLFDGRFLPFSRLDGESQDKVLEAWRDSHLVVRRTGYQALRKLCLAAHYAMPSSWPSVPFPTPTPIAEPYDDSKMGTPEWNKAHGLEGPP